MNFHLMKMRCWVIPPLRKPLFPNSLWSIILAQSYARYSKSHIILKAQSLRRAAEEAALSRSSCTSSLRQTVFKGKILQIVLSARNWSVPWNCCVISHWLRQPVFPAPLSAEMWCVFFSSSFFSSLLFTSSHVYETSSHTLNDSWWPSVFPKIWQWPQSHKTRLSSEFGYWSRQQLTIYINFKFRPKIVPEKPTTIPLSI